ncbi:MAG: outer membrane beta-barrel protein [Pseudomonadota bacterium]
MDNLVWKPASSLAFGLLCWSNAASAQETSAYFDRSSVVPVSEQSNPAYDAKPILIGNFVVQPEALFSAGQSSNVLASPYDEIEDTYVGFAPKVAIASDWQRHAVGALIDVDHREFQDLSDESRTNVKLKLRGRLDFGKSTSLTLDLAAADLNEERSALSALPTALEPNEYTQTEAGLTFKHEAGRFAFETGAALSQFDYDDAELQDDLFLDQDFRDRDEFTGTARVALAFDPSLAVYSQVQYVLADYAPAGFFNPFNRDYDGVVALVGTDFAFGRRVSGDIAVGYQYYSYDDPSFEEISDVAFVGNLDVMLARRTSLSASAERKVIDPGQLLTNAAIETGGQVRLEHGLTQKLSLSGEAGIAQYAFETIERDDDRVDLKLGANWKINPSIWLEGGYEVIDQTSDVQEFTDNRMLLRMRIFP